MEELNDLLLQRRTKIDDLRQQGVNPYANDFPVAHTSADVMAAHETQDAEALKDCPHHYTLAGRIMARRDFGKAAFIQVQDRKGRMGVNPASGEKMFIPPHKGLTFRPSKRLKKVTDKRSPKPRKSKPDSKSNS